MRRDSAHLGRSLEPTDPVTKRVRAHGPVSRAHAFCLFQRDSEWTCGFAMSADAASQAGRRRFESGRPLCCQVLMCEALRTTPRPGDVGLFCVEPISVSPYCGPRIAYLPVPYRDDAATVSAAVGAGSAAAGVASPWSAGALAMPPRLGAAHQRSREEAPSYERSMLAATTKVKSRLGAVHLGAMGGPFAESFVPNVWQRAIVRTYRHSQCLSVRRRIPR